MTAGYSAVTLSGTSPRACPRACRTARRGAMNTCSCLASRRGISMMLRRCGSPWRGHYMPGVETRMARLSPSITHQALFHAIHCACGGRKQAATPAPSGASLASLRRTHFATFPTALVRRCLLAGLLGRCARHVGTVETGGGATVFARWEPFSHGTLTGNKADGDGVGRRNNDKIDHGKPRPPPAAGPPVTAWQAGRRQPPSSTPSAGSGAALLVARELGHDAIGADLSYPYLHDVARERSGLADLARWEGRTGHGTPAVTSGDLPFQRTRRCLEAAPPLRVEADASGPRRAGILVALDHHSLGPGAAGARDPADGGRAGGQRHRGLGQHHAPLCLQMDRQVARARDRGLA